MKNQSSYRYRKLTSCKCLKIRQASRLITQFYDKKLKPYGLRITQFSILAHLASFGSQTISQLSSELKIDRTTLTRSLDILHSKRFVEDESNSDKRFRRVNLTQQGFNILDKVTPLWLDAEQNIYKHIKQNKLSVF